VRVPPYWGLSDEVVVVVGGLVVVVITEVVEVAEVLVLVGLQEARISIIVIDRKPIITYNLFFSNEIPPINN